MSSNNLLILDDDITVCETLRLVGVSCGYESKSITNPNEFIHHFEIIMPEVILLDLNLGKIDGIEILRQLTNYKHNTKIILISGYDDKVLHSALLFGRSRELNIITALHKPIKIDKLKELLLSLQFTYQSLTSEMIKEGMKNNEFLLYYQPQLSIETNKLTGVEALIRWRKPDGTVIPPDAFIPVAEENELIMALSLWITQQAVEQSAKFRKIGIALTMSINFSAKLLTNLSLPDDIERLVKQYGLKPDNFCIEITETAALHNLSTTLDILTRLRLKGFLISIDDFGTGFSSLVQLHRSPCSELKIDQSFITNLTEDSSDLIIVRSTIRLGHDLGLTIVSEGIETPLTYKLLKKLGCDVAQGYLLARPMPANELLQWISENFDDTMTHKFSLDGS